jgi:hypothetical protein
MVSACLAANERPAFDPHLLVIDIQPLLLVGDDGVRFPGIPQGVGDFHPFFRHLVAVIVFEVLVVAEVLGTAVRARGHEIEADASLREKIEGRAEAGGMKGMGEARRKGRDDPDA